MDEETDGMSIEEQMLKVLEGMLRTRNSFLDVRTLRMIDNSQRTAIFSRYLLTDAVMLDMMNRIYNSTTQTRNFATNMLTYAAATAMPYNFTDPVPVVPTVRQVNNSLENITVTSDTRCAICQEQISSGAARIRQCLHVYHRQCILNWFSMSVRCPVCRHDIREEGREAQTSADEEQT